MKRGVCPSCRGQATKQDNKWWPFCSERCHLVDLGNWLDERYRIPLATPDDDVSTSDEE